MSVPKRWLHGEWSRPFAFVVAMAGAAIGLGHVWTFPHLVATHGGGAFLLIYGVFLALLVLPLWLAEIGVARAMRASLPRALYRIAGDQGGVRSGWLSMGWLVVTAAGVMLAFQAAAAGWLGAWLHATVVDPSLDFDVVTTAALFADIWDRPERFLLWHTLAVAAAGIVVGRGYTAGLEPVMRAMVAAMLLLFLGLLAWLALQADLGSAWRAVFDVRTAMLGWDGVRAAGEYALFSTAAALGIAAAFGAALPSRWPTASAAGAGLALQALFAVLAALFVVMAMGTIGGMDGQATGPTLIFHDLPQALTALPGGREALLALFSVLVMAVLTTVIALMEVVVSAVTEQGRLRRVGAAALVAGAAWLAGPFLALVAQGWFHTEAVAAVRSDNSGTLIAVDAGRALVWTVIPGVALVLLVFTGWCTSWEPLRGALHVRDTHRHEIVRLGLRYVAPALLLGLLVSVARLAVF